MGNKIKSILIIVVIILASSSISVMASTLINSKEVIYDNSKTGIEATNVQTAVDELYSAATDYNEIKERLGNLEKSLNTDNYIKPTPVDGVTILYVGYIKVGKLVIVNMTLSIDKTKLTLSQDARYRTKILMNLPKGKEKKEVLSVDYAGIDSNKNATLFSANASVEDGNLMTQESAINPNVYGWGFTVTGTYLTSD